MISFLIAILDWLWNGSFLSRERGFRGWVQGLDPRAGSNGLVHAGPTRNTPQYMRAKRALMASYTYIIYMPKIQGRCKSKKGKHMSFLICIVIKMIPHVLVCVATSWLKIISKMRRYFCLPLEGQEVVNLLLLLLLVGGIISFFFHWPCLQTSYKVLLDY